MASDDDDLDLMPSFLNRLTEPRTAELFRQQRYTVAHLEAAVLRDLSDLLNSHRLDLNDLLRRRHKKRPRSARARRGAQKPPQELKEVRQSILCYGLPDLTTMAALTPQDFQEIGAKLREAIECFEPRLHVESVEPPEGLESRSMSARFRIRARLAVEPAPTTAFNTVVDLTTGRCSVQPPS